MLKSKKQTIIMSGETEAPLKNHLYKIKKNLKYFVDMYDASVFL